MKAANHTERAGHAPESFFPSPLVAAEPERVQDTDHPRPLPEVSAELATARRARAADLVVEVLLRCGVKGAVGVPDSQLQDLLGALARFVPLVYAAREDVAIGMAAGAQLAGQHHAVFMKNAGLGPSLDALLALGKAAEIPLTLVVGAAGTGRDQLPHHVVTGERTLALLDAAGLGSDIVPHDGHAAPKLLAARLSEARHLGLSHALVVKP